MGSKNSSHQDHHHRDSYGCRASSNPSSSPNVASYADGRSKLQSKYSRFGDDYNSLEQVKMLLNLQLVWLHLLKLILMSELLPHHFF